MPVHQSGAGPVITSSALLRELSSARLDVHFIKGLLAENGQTGSRAHRTTLALNDKLDRAIRIATDLTKRDSTAALTKIMALTNRCAEVGDEDSPCLPDREQIVEINDLARIALESATQ